jgi:ubiquinone/menaquinone biosynthesis C-methylase UbiE
MASISSNRDTYDNPRTWKQRGDSWTFHAEACGQPYETWKHSLVENFLVPFLGTDVDVLEVGPGFGRWTEFMVGHTHSLTLVDVSSTCIDACRQRFGAHLLDESFVVNDGRSLPVKDSSLDLVWSFGAFVHMDEPEFTAYLAECQRTLRPGGRFVIHHTGWRNLSFSLLSMTRFLGRAGLFVRGRVLGVGRRNRAGRAPMSAASFARMATERGFVVDRQVRSWGDRRQFSLTFNDVISIGTKLEQPEDRAAHLPG